MDDGSFAPSATALRIATERGQAWEYRYFFQILSDEMERSRGLKWSPSLGSGVTVSLEATPAWLSNRLDAVKSVNAGLTEFMNADHSDAFGPPGQPGDAVAIALYARKVVTMYRQAIEWVHSVRYAEVDACCREATYELAMFEENVLKAVEDFGPSSLQKIDQALQTSPGWTLELGLVLTADSERMVAAAERLGEAIRRRELTPSVSLPCPGYIYVLSNPSLGRLLKIGRTSRNSRNRAEELSSATGVPTPFVLAFDAYVVDCMKAEAYVHARLSSSGHRVANNREFFNVDVTTAINAVLEAQRVVASDWRDT